jgi:hypothetical protein
MAYNKFNYKTVGEKLGLEIEYNDQPFQHCTPVSPRPMILELLTPNDNFPLMSEISRREWLVSNVFRELIYQTGGAVSVYSGEQFDVEPSLGLNDEADYLITKGKAKIPLKGTIIAVAQAKPDNLLTGLGQCIAEMYAAKLFNERSGTPTARTFGVVTTGLQWGFLVLEGTNVSFDPREYNISDVDEILGILIYMTQNTD